MLGLLYTVNHIELGQIAFVAFTFRQRITGRTANMRNLKMSTTGSKKLSKLQVSSISVLKIDGKSDEADEPSPMNWISVLSC